MVRLWEYFSVIRIPQLTVMFMSDWLSIVRMARPLVMFVSDGVNLRKDGSVESRMGWMR